MDPDFYDDESTAYDGDLEDFCEGIDDSSEDLGHALDFDTEVEQDIKDRLYEDHLNADQIGLAMAFGDLIYDEKKVYEVNEDTDRENWNKAMELQPLQRQCNSSAPFTFENYVGDITSGRCNGPWTKHRE